MSLSTFEFLMLTVALTTFGGAFVLIKKYRNAREEMRVAKEFFQSMFDSAAVGMAVADIEGRYIKVNRAMCDFVGYPEHELLNMSYHDVTFHEDLEKNIRARQRLLKGELPTFQQEKRYVRKNGDVVWAVMVVSQVVDKNGKVIYSIGQMIDIDVQKRTEANLRASQERLANAQRVAKIGDWTWSVADDTVEWSDMLGRILGAAPSEFPKNYRQFLEWAPFNRRGFVQETVQKSLDSLEAFGFDGPLIGSDGTRRFVSMRGEVIPDGFGKPRYLRGTLQDITERRQAELALLDSRRLLRELAAHQKNLLEEDRKRIAREVHDELGQRLTALKMDISLLRLRFGHDPALHQKLAEMRTLADTTINVVRDIASDLRPAALDLGLVSAIQWLAEDMELRSDICARLELATEDVAMSDAQATVVFRIVQESLTNIVRHANASEVIISLREDQGQLQLQVIDDGCGFNTRSAKRTRGYGILGMRERVRGLGGSLQIESRPNAGTTVSIALPLQRRTVN